MGRDWTKISLVGFDAIRGSGCTCEATSKLMPSWARQAEQVRRVFVYALAPEESIPSVMTTDDHVARLLTERYDPEDQSPWNYNWYAVVEAPDGVLYQSGPCRDVDFGHQLRTRPGFLRSYPKSG